jgi:hypothetical protein
MLLFIAGVVYRRFHDGRLNYTTVLQARCRGMTMMRVNSSGAFYL